MKCAGRTGNMTLWRMSMVGAAPPRSRTGYSGFQWAPGIRNMRAMSLHRNFIGGAWIDGVDAGDNINPSNTNDVVGNYARASREQADQAISAARAAFPAWSRSGIQQRHDILKKVSDEI